ncbi:EAL domain-containing protein [Phormidium sp. LEGE 05292]|uniref:sensor domain-containing protein n=1 Tax=[Phormidium] sp. LEGE 05292 TaxID=767427 RepID=UPI001882A656|nr:EAL domain-containing protein [Phormidium sp. LEGE 05292]MBE9225115.1 EAL domain-containing protein [Phormidium sp. LEGE 05292]
MLTKAKPIIIDLRRNPKDITDRKAMEFSLSQSNNILRAVIEDTTDAIFIKDLQGRYLFVNAAIAKIFGKPAGEIVGKDDTEFFALETARKIMENDRRIISSGQSESVEEIVFINNNTQVYLSTKNVYRNSQGEIIGLIGIAREITDRKQAEEERLELVKKLSQEREDLTALSKVTANAVSTLNLADLLNILLQRIVEVIKADAGVILLKEGDRISVRATIGIEAEVRSGFSVAIGQGFAGTIAASHQPLYIEDVQANPLIISPILKQLNIRTMMGVPLKRNGNLVGVLHVDWFKIHPFSDRELHLLEITAERCAMAIINAQLYEQTKQLQESLQLQIERMPIGCILKDENFRIIDWNPTAEKIFGYTKQEALGKYPEQLINFPGARPVIQQIRQQLEAGKMIDHNLMENITKDGRVIICEWHNTPLKDAKNQIINYLSMVQDVTDRKQAEKKLQHYAYYDPITGLPNRTLFLKRLEETINLAKHNQDNLFAVLFLNLDRFQMVKFSLGHHLADRLLVNAAQRIKNCLQNRNFSFFDVDLESNLTQENQNFPNPIIGINNIVKNSSNPKKSLVAQVGLDEFAILLTNLRETSNATQIADQIYQTLSYPFDLDEQEVFISTSIGIAFSSVGYQQPEDYLRAADTAMHQTKQLSKTRYAVFEPGWQTQAIERLQLETDLRRAIERKEFQVYYQPIVSIKNGKLIGFEALVRWHHSTRGWVSPGEFIPIAEETGLISLIDRYVLREACQQMVIWKHKFPEKFPLTISVNLSAAQLAQLGLIERIDQILQETGINRESLKIEITESNLTENCASEIVMLQQLKTLGIQLSIDDFGTGYSSLARLHQLPIDTLKIDRSFINQMVCDNESLEIVRTIISLAHILQMDVIAEGVETTEQLLQLQSLECEYSQGFLFSRPVDRQTAETLISDNNLFISENINNQQ